MAAAASAQPVKPPPSEVAGIAVNYDEARAGGYTLPDPLLTTSGKRVTNARLWRRERRPELIRLFETHQFGRSPGRPDELSFDVFERQGQALGGKALRRQVTIRFSKNPDGPKANLLMYLPAKVNKKSPMLLSLSFSANSSVVDDPGVRPGEIWGKERKRVPAPKPIGQGRAVVERLIDAGFGYATIYYGDIEPDFADGIQHGVRRLYLKPGEQKPADDEWGAIAAWAWGLSRVMDYLETDRGVDAKRVAIMGVSRLGKTVLWTGARDERFRMVIASCSGEGGAALSRRNYGETVAHLTAPSRYWYQFSGNYAKSADDPAKLPVDAHLLISLIAPRPLLLQTGDQDYWSDPRGEFLAAVAAGPVYRLLGAKDLSVTEMPAAGAPVLNTLGYLMHAGGHGLVPSDWDTFLEFMRRYL